MRSVYFLLATMVGIGALGCQREPGSAPDGQSRPASSVTLLNVSYDPTREFYYEFNQAFARHWLESTGQRVTVDQSHGGSGKQARSVIDGLQADVVTLALAYDIDAIALQGGLIDPDWQSRLPERSCPYHSTIVFLVRPGNPKGIRDWDDLVRDDVEVITPNPKTSGAARWAYLAAWGFALHQELGGFDALSDASRSSEVEAAQQRARAFITRMYRRVPVLDSAARASTNTFSQRGIGDVLLAWENEAFLALKEMRDPPLEIVYPSLSIRAEPPVAIVDRTVDRRQTRLVATAYLDYLYSVEGQSLAAKHFYRPSQTEQIEARFLQVFQSVTLFSLSDVFGSWREAQQLHFADGGVFDQIYQPGS